MRREGAHETAKVGLRKKEGNASPIFGEAGSAGPNLVLCVKILTKPTMGSGIESPISRRTDSRQWRIFMIKRIFLVTLLAAVAAVASAQADFFHRPSPLAGRTMLTLSLFEEVKAELKTNTEFNGKVDGLLEKLQAEMQEVFQNANGDFSSIRPAMEKINAKYDEEVAKLLSADQVSRLKQLFIQFNGEAAIPNAAISKDLEITDDQKAKIKQAQDENGKKLMEGFQNGDSPEDRQKNMVKLQDEFKATIGKLLTDDQRAKFKTMQGAKFEFKKVTADGGG